MTWADRRGACVERRSRATNHVNFPTHDGGHAATARRRHRGQRSPAVRRRIVFPGIVDRVPARRPRSRKVEAAEHVHFSVRHRDGRVVDRMWHRLLLRPRVAARIVLVDEAGRLEPRQQPLRGVELAVDRRPQQLSCCLGKWREPDPLSLRRSRRVAHCGRRARGLGTDAHSREGPHQLLPGDRRHESQAGGHKGSPAHAAHLPVQAARPKGPLK